MKTSNKRLAVVRGMQSGVVLCVLLLGVLGSGVPVAGQSLGTVKPLTPRNVASNDDDVRIGVGDLVEVRVFDTPELSNKVRVSPDASVDIPVAGKAFVGGLTPQQASEVIEGNLRKALIMQDPHVTVFITEYATQSVSVLGEVKTPGNYLLLGPHSLYNALSAAGGINQKGGGSIVITHQEDPKNPEIVNISTPNYASVQQTTKVRAGDVIFVSRADSIYVLGDVFRPGEFQIEGGQPLSVLNAIALAQGANVTAALTKISIIRKTSNGTTTIAVNLKHITDGADQNVLLRKDDILVIPRDRRRAFVDATLPGLTGAVAGSAMAALILR